MEDFDNELHSPNLFKLLAIALMVAFWQPHHGPGVWVISTVWLQCWQRKIFLSSGYFGKSFEINIAKT